MKSGNNKQAAHGQWRSAGLSKSGYIWFVIKLGQIVSACKIRPTDLYVPRAVTIFDTMVSWHTDTGYYRRRPCNAMRTYHEYVLLSARVWFRSCLSVALTPKRLKTQCNALSFVWVTSRTVNPLKLKAAAAHHQSCTAWVIGFAKHLCITATLYTAAETSMQDCLGRVNTAFPSQRSNVVSAVELLLDRWTWCWQKLSFDYSVCYFSLQLYLHKADGADVRMFNFSFKFMFFLSDSCLYVTSTANSVNRNKLLV